MGKSELYGDAALFFLLEPVCINACHGFHQGGLAMIDVPSGTQNDLFHRRYSRLFIVSKSIDGPLPLTQPWGRGQGEGAYGCNDKYGTVYILQTLELIGFYRLVWLWGKVETPRLQAKQVFPYREATCHSGESPNPVNTMPGISGCRIESGMTRTADSNQPS
jgi:hypothetical protein